MANEVIIEEYGAYDINMPIPTVPLTTQIKSIGTLSNALNAQTKYVRIRAKGAGFWYAFGDATASATANTAGSTYLADGDFVDHKVDKSIRIDTAADA